MKTKDTWYVLMWAENYTTFQLFLNSTILPWYNIAMVSNVSLEKFVKCKNVFHLFRFVVVYIFILYLLPPLLCKFKLYVCR